MKVLVAHNRYVSGVPSGENVVVDDEIRALGAAGIDVVPYLRSSDEIAARGPVRRLGAGVSATWSPAAVRDVRRLVETHHPDVMHLHNPYPLISPAVIRVAHAYALPVVQTVHNFRLVCANGTYFRDGHVCHDCRGMAIPYPAVHHACYRGSRPQSAAMAISMATHRRTWRSVDRFLALTDRIAEHLVSAGIRRDRVTVRPNTVPDPGAHSTDRRGVLFAGRLTEDKGIRVLLDAWTRVAPGSLGTLTIAGAGPERGTVEAMATSREDVVYLGALPPARVIELMLRAAAVVVPSVWADVFPRVVVESLACGTAVVASDIGGFPSIVTPDVGSLAGPGDAQALAHALRHVTGDATSLGAAARRRYLQHYSPDVVMRQLIAVYGQLAGRGRGA